MTTFTVLDNGAVAFTSTRLLDPQGGSDTYVIPLDTPINMICAYLNTTHNLIYHGANNHFTWDMTISSTGEAALTNGGALKPIVTGPIVSLPNGSQLWASWNQTANAVVYDVLVVANSYFGIGYGIEMLDTDMAIWDGNPDQPI